MSKQIWRILVFSLTFIILTKPIGADSSEIGGAQAVFAPVTRFVVRFQRKMAHIEAYQVYASILQIKEISIGAVLEDNTGGERIQVVENTR